MEKYIKYDSEKLRKVVLSRYDTLTDCSRDLGFSSNYVSNLLNRGEWRKERIWFICKFLGIEVEDILPDPEPKFEIVEDPNLTEPEQIEIEGIHKMNINYKLAMIKALIKDIEDELK